MKKIIIFFIALCIASGCQSEKTASPQEVTAAFLQALQEQDSAAIVRLSQWEMSELMMLQLQEDDYIEGVDRQLQEEMHQHLYDFTYEIKEADVQEEEAQVAVTLRMYDMSMVWSDGLEEIQQDVKKRSEKEELPEEAMQTLLITSLYEKAVACEERKSMSISVALTKEADGWRVIHENAQLMDAILRNLQQMIAALQ